MGAARWILGRIEVDAARLCRRLDYDMLVVSRNGVPTAAAPQGRCPVLRVAVARGRVAWVEPPK